MALNRRLPSEDPRSVSEAPWPNARAPIIRMLRGLMDQAQGIPAGFLGTVATTIQAGVAAAAGALTAGWAAANHTHAVDTGTPVDLGEANAEGTGTSLARASHVHKLLVRVAKAGTTVGTRKRLNFIDGSGATVTVADDAGADEVDITIAAIPAPDPADLEYMSWVL